MNALAETAKGLGDEMAQRIDDLKEAGHMDAHAAEAMSGIMEGLASLELALASLPKVLGERLEGLKPAPRGTEEGRAT